MKTKSITTPDLIQREKRMRFNPLRSLTPETLAQALDSFLYGDLRQAALLWEMIADRDDTIPGVKFKREADTAHRDWQVLTKDDSREAKRHKEVLDAFWGQVTATNAFDRNETGGISRLIKQMMSAVSYKYAAHHLVWSPRANDLTAEFEFVPLHFFENRTGKLRFIRDGVGTEGEEMKPGEWMVHTGQGLMMACSIAYTFKRLSYHDWLAFSDKFAMPGTLGRTSAAQGSEAGNALKEAVESFGNDWSAVIYGDDGSGKIELVEAKANNSTLPFPSLIERADRKIAALYRGADLSTMSAGSGEGSGASLQGGEADILALDDAVTVSETLNGIERHVLAWYFGKGVKPKAYCKILVPVKEDMQLLLEAIKAFVELGAPIEIADVLERFGFAKPKEGAELLKSAMDRKALADAAAAGLGANGTAVNAKAGAMDMDFIAQATRLLHEAGKEDREQLVKELRRIMAMTDEEAMKEELKGFLKSLPTAISQDAAQQSAWEKIMMGAFFDGAASLEEAA